MKKQSTLKRALALGMSATMVGATLAGLQRFSSLSVTNLYRNCIVCNH